ncbi:hypothetical protein ACN47H_24520, partial [Klebsiella quasipneumoniae]|uniref:hypothetical protein n=1 Tax=Klebsiella quasipneumoniae TaxID=1463165 RepID=UPI003AF5E6D8
KDITQKTYRERNLSGNNIEVVALPGALQTGKLTIVPLFRRVAAAPYWPPPVRSLRYGKQSAEKLTGSAICPELTQEW